MRPGVLCRAAGGFRGACSGEVGVRDVARCVSSCTHRLETAAAATDQWQTLAWHLDVLDDPETATNPFALEFTRQGILTALIGGVGADELPDRRLRSFLKTLSAAERTRLPEPVLGAIERLLEAS